MAASLYNLNCEIQCQSTASLQGRSTFSRVYGVTATNAVCFARMRQTGCLQRDL